MLQVIDEMKQARVKGFVEIKDSFKKENYCYFWQLLEKKIEQIYHFL
jgi:hypothetical protein